MEGITTDQIHKMVQDLAKKGPNIEMGTAKTMVDNKKESLPLLIDLLGKTEVWEPPHKDYSAWTPIAIIHLLSLMGGKDAFEAVRKATLVYYDDAGDWITTDFPSVAATFGSEMLDELVDILKDGSIDIWIRVGVVNALFMISNDNKPEIKEEAVKVLKETISKEKQDKNARTMLVDELVNFKDQGSLSFIKVLFEDRMLDESIVTFKDVCDIYEGKYDDIIKDKIKNPIHIFKEGSFYRQSNSGDFIKQVKPDGEEEEKEDMQINDTPYVKKIGRNDPCPCGSGKKYKKCCMLL